MHPATLVTLNMRELDWPDGGIDATVRQIAEQQLTTVIVYEFGSRQMSPEPEFVGTRDWYNLVRARRARLSRDVSRSNSPNASVTSG
ncbi:hypothetical protein P3T23_003394 [Paraburkholderia sp. GAS448]|uniref:hypothetical protein n=1 Tax=Paraburkholderia sp. GAS448 TaxID=3035136 RepID=UPI003D1D8FA2